MATRRDLSDSTDRSVAIARALLAPPPRRDASLAVLGSAALCAASALALALSVILGPPMQPRAPDAAPAITGRSVPGSP